MLLMEVLVFLYFLLLRLDLHLTRQMRDEYPQGFIEVLERNGRPFHRLPILDIGVRRDDYITYIEPQQMNRSVMRFRDIDGYSGIAIKIRLRVHMRYAGGRFDLNPGDEIVLTIFKRHTNPENGLWVYGWSGSDSRIESLCKRRHDNNVHDGEMHHLACPACPFGTVDRIYPVISSLLRGEDPDIMLPRNEVEPERRFSLKSCMVITALACFAIAPLLNRIYDNRAI